MREFYVIQFFDTDGSGGIVSIDGAPFCTDNAEWAQELWERLAVDYPQYEHKLMKLVDVLESEVRHDPA